MRGRFLLLLPTGALLQSNNTCSGGPPLRLFRSNGKGGSCLTVLEWLADTASLTLASLALTSLALASLALASLTLGMEGNKVRLPVLADKASSQ